MSIDLNFNEQQTLIQDTAREVFARHCPPALVRRFQDHPEEFPRDLWGRMAELGWLGMTLPAEYGGLDCAFLDSYVLYLELGRSLAPVPHLETVTLAGGLVAALGDARRKAGILRRIVGGEAIFTCALMEPDGLYGPAGIALPARRDGDRFLLNGTKVLVPYARSAEALICAVRTGAAASFEEGVSLFLVDPHAAGVTIEPTPGMSGHPLSAVAFDDVAVTAADALGPIGGAWPVLHETLMKAAVLQSAMIIGAGERVLEISVGYAKDRVQFGEPIGKHQAVQYLVTDIAIHAHNTRLLALQAAWRIEAGLPFLREASLAKAAASKAAAAMTFAAHEVHAGIGFMLDYDLQLYTQRAKYWESNLGDQRYHLERVMAETPPGPEAVSFNRGLALTPQN
jgi:alkylation response protein AidB-like acyl-CoA dehydrogenase